MNSVLLITDDGRGIAQALANEFRGLGKRAVLIQMRDRMGVVGQDCYAADLTDPTVVAGLLDVIRQQENFLAGLIHLLPLQAGLPFEAMDFGEWRQRLRLEVKSLFYLAKAMASDLKQAAARPGGGWLLAATAMGGRFASDTDGPLSFFPGQGGIPGLIKTATVEWPDVHCRVVDVDSEVSASTLASLLLREMGNTHGQVEVGYKDSRRSVLRSQPAPLEQDRSIHLAIDSSWVVMITGGARGITAEVACELASRYRPTLILIGRAPLPEAEEPPETAGLTSVSELKAALMARLRRMGQSVTPPLVEAAHSRLVHDREMRIRLAAMQQAGATVRYCQADVRDPLSFGAIIDDIYREHGRLDGVIHGAGIIEDKLLEDKSPESFDRVFDTKVDSTFILSQRLRPDTLKFLVFFASVAGRFGNRGQADYAAANEVLNKLAVYLDRRWPARVVAINWGPWLKGGMVSPEVERQFARRGVHLIAPAVGSRMLDAELRYGRKGEVEVVIGGGPWARTATRQSSSLSDALPLLDGVRLRLGGGGAVEVLRTLDPACDRFLQDHLLDGKPVFPAAMAMELMAEVAQKAWPDREVVGVRSLRVLRGIILDDGPKTIRVVARPQTQPDDERLELEVAVEIGELDRPAHVCYRATVRLAEQLPDPPAYEPPAKTDWQDFPLAVGEAYRLWLFHGPTFQCISEIRGIDAQGIAAAVIPSSPQRCLQNARSGQWLLDPVLIDSGPQLAILWARARQDMTALPSSIRSYTRFGSLSGSPLRCDFQVLPGSNEQTVLANVFFVGSDGRLRGMLEGLEATCSKALNRLAGCTPPVSGGCQ